MNQLNDGQEFETGGSSRLLKTASRYLCAAVGVWRQTGRPQRLV